MPITAEIQISLTCINSTINLFSANSTCKLYIYIYIYKADCRPAGTCIPVKYAAGVDASRNKNFNIRPARLRTSFAVEVPRSYFLVPTPELLFLAHRNIVLQKSATKNVAKNLQQMGLVWWKCNINGDKTCNATNLNTSCLSTLPQPLRATLMLTKKECNA